VGRGAQGAPWRIAQIAHALHGTPAPSVPQGDALAALVAEHHEAILSFYGRDLGLRVARKHLGWYADAAGALPELRAAMLTATTEADVRALIVRAFTDLTPAPRKEAA
jgi:tRNA-dihydrouridine synthase